MKLIIKKRFIFIAVSILLLPVVYGIFFINYDYQNIDNFIIFEHLWIFFWGIIFLIYSIYKPQLLLKRRNYKKIYINQKNIRYINISLSVILFVFFFSSVFNGNISMLWLLLGLILLSNGLSKVVYLTNDEVFFDNRILVFSEINDYSSGKHRNTIEITISGEVHFIAISNTRVKNAVIDILDDRYS